MSLANVKAASFEDLVEEKDLKIKNLEKEIDELQQLNHQSSDEKQHDMDMDKGKSIK